MRVQRRVRACAICGGASPQQGPIWFAASTTAAAGGFDRRPLGGRAVARQTSSHSGYYGWTANYPIGPYKIDVAFPELKIAVEIRWLGIPQRPATRLRPDRKRPELLGPAGLAGPAVSPGSTSSSIHNASSPRSARAISARLSHAERAISAPKPLSDGALPRRSTAPAGSRRPTATAWPALSWPALMVSLRQRRRRDRFGFRGCLGHVAGVERRLRVVFDPQLDGFGAVFADDLAGQPQRQVDARRHAGAA